ncbi:mycothiol synthase [Corynebacterium lubricantis]|uniref:mycothiol synthase n=1 Tax=Corynebacterium lubricantis TaxID=541095 RepID=UPI00037AD90D|nr:mycothiol synthase [Corynebacterium lubricantis]
MTNFEITTHVLPNEPELRESVEAVLRRAEENDGVAPFSEAFINGLGDARLGHEHLLIDDSSVAAVAPDGGVELVVSPELRGQGRGTHLVKQVLAEVENASLWAHGNLPEALQLAESLGLETTRRLLVMSVGGAALEQAAVFEAPDGIEALSYPQAVERFGRESVEQAWLDANNDAFSWHPEQGGWDLDQLHRGMEADWFDPNGVLFLYSGEQLAGFHWTKMHPAEGSDVVGEVYVVGLASAFRGQGMGDPLLRVGLDFLVRQGASTVILYVEADNVPAVARYEDLGFAITEDHVVYKRN